MDKILSYIQGLDIDFSTYWQSGLILLLGVFMMSILGRFVFGKRSLLNHSASSAIGILFIYAVTILLRTAKGDFQFLITPLPFVEINGTQMSLFNFENAHYTVICAEVLSMTILAFLVNLADAWLPKGKSIITWLFFRCLTVIIAYLLHLIVVTLFTRYLPDVLVTYAPVILLLLLVLLLLTGVLKIVVGAVLTTVNPILGGLYTFFFATVVGKHIVRALVTTALLVLLIFALQWFGFCVFSIASAALIAYIPFILVLVVLWYIVMRYF